MARVESSSMRKSPWSYCLPRRVGMRGMAPIHGRRICPPCVCPEVMRCAWWLFRLRAMSGLCERRIVAVLGGIPFRTASMLSVPAQSSVNPAMASRSAPREIVREVFWRTEMSMSSRTAAMVSVRSSVRRGVLSSVSICPVS